MKNVFFRLSYGVKDFFRRLAQKRREESAKVPEMAFQSLAGDPVFLTDLIAGKKGAALWMTNLCEGCQEKIPFAQKLHDRYGRDVAFIAVSILGEDRATPRAVCGRYDLSFPLLIDPMDEVSRTLGFAHAKDACPLRNIIVFGADRRIRFKHHFSAVSEKVFEQVLMEVADDRKN